MNNRIAILLTTFLRDELLKETIQSIIKYFPENSFLYVGDQGIHTKEKDNYFKALFEKSGNVFFYKLPYDCGLSFARNYLVSKASMNNIPYCLITADSIQFTDKYPFQDIIKGMVNKEDALVGLNIADRIPWEWNIDLIPKKHFWLSKIPDYDIVQFKDFTIKKVSMCRNFFLAKTEALLDVKWDNELKLCIQENMPITTKNGWEHIKVLPIKNLFPPSVKQNTYKYEERSKLTIYTPEGFKKLKRIKRQKTTKTIYCLNTNCDYIELTEDHPILINRGLYNEWKEPKNLNIGDIIAHNKEKVELSNSIEVSPDWAWMLGLFLAEGTCKGKGDRIEITNQDVSFLKKCEKTFNTIGIKCEWYSNLNRKDKCHFLRVKAPKLLINYFKEFYHQGEKIIPYFIYDFTKESLNHFLKGFWDGDGTKQTGYSPCILSQKSASIMQGLIILFRSAFESYKIRPQGNHIGAWFKLTFKGKFREPNPHVITAIKTRENTSYVYDIEIEEPHTFVCGIGNAIVHNCEHEDFFWRFKTKGYKCTWTDYITAKYVDSKPKEYKDLRDRMYHTFQYILLKKYKIVQWMKWEIENE